MAAQGSRLFLDTDGETKSRVSFGSATGTGHTPPWGTCTSTFTITTDLTGVRAVQLLVTGAIGPNGMICMVILTGEWNRDMTSGSGWDVVRIMDVPFLVI